MFLISFKKAIITIKKNLIPYIAAFLIMPMVFAIIYSSMNEIDSIDLKQKVVKFNMPDDNNFKTYFNNILKDENIKKIIISNDYEYDYEITINEDLSNIHINSNNNEYASIITNIVKSIIEGYKEYRVYNDTIKTSSLSTIKMGQLYQKIYSNQSELITKINPHLQVITQHEYFTLSMYSFMMMLIIFTVSSNFYREIKEGINQRTLVAPITKTKLFYITLLSNFFIIFIFQFIYILINFILRFAFNYDILSLFILSISLSILAALTTGFFFTFFKNIKVASTFMTIILIIPMFIGGVWFNSEVISPGILKTISNLVPNALILNSLKALAINNNFNVIVPYLILIVICSAIFYGLSYLKVKMKWEV